MTYTKRWELVLILGGKCSDCEDENFYNLEIDHINNDGDGDRKYYTRLDQKYTSNPVRARQRLQILCKKCHEKKHTFVYEPDTYIKPEIGNMRIFMEILKDLEGNSRIPVSEDILVTSIVETTRFDSHTARMYIRRLLREASIYESRIGSYNRV